MKNTFALFIFFTMSVIFSQEREKIVRDVQVPEAIIVSELANRMAERSAEVVKH